ncbi:MAG: ABC transporter permease [Candidatus Thermoplasmatota archaeon]
MLSTTEKLGFIWIYLYRSAKLLSRFKISLIVSFVAMFVQISIFYYINKFVGTVPMYTDYFSYVIIGLAINQLMQTTLTTYLQTMHNIYWSNWLEILLTSPVKTNTFFISVMIWNYLMVSINIAFYLIIGIFVFHASFSISVQSLLLLLPIIVLLIISLSGIGLISASMFMLANAKGNIEPIGWAMTTLTGLVAGVYFPPDYLPTIIQSISKILPQTYAINAIRGILINREEITSSDIQVSIFYLVIFSIIFLPVGIWMFNLGIKKAEREGTLARWT